MSPTDCVGKPRAIDTEHVSDLRERLAVCELQPTSVTRWNTWIAAHAKVRMVVELGPDVIDVEQVGPSVLAGGVLWITPTRTGPMESNDEATHLLLAAISGDAGVP